MRKRFSSAVRHLFPKPGPLTQRNMTLIEVMFAIFLVSLVIGGLMMSLFQATQSTAVASHHAAAMQLCLELAEEMRAGEFDAIVQENYPLETGLQLITAGRSREAVLCNRKVTISDASTEGIEARRVKIDVDWTYRNMLANAPYETIIYNFHD